MSEQAALAPVESALRQTELITAFGIALGSLENLLHPEAFADDGVISWQVGRTRFKWTASKHADVLAKVLSPPGYQAMVAFRIAAALVVLNPSSDRKSKSAALWYLTASNLLSQLRNSFGSDGTDHMNLLTVASLAASSLFPNDRRAREAAAWFITAQSCLSYLTAGVAKLVSPYWRDGTAMTGIFRTHTYGDERVYRLLKKYPVLSKLGGWAVIAGEMAFPLVLVAPKKPAKGLLGTGLAFHAGNAVFMGLNRFVWTFSGTYPAVAHCSRALRKRAR